MMKPFIKTTKEVSIGSTLLSGSAIALNSLGSHGEYGLKAVNTTSKFLPAYATLSLMKNTAQYIDKKRFLK